MRPSIRHPSVFHYQDLVRIGQRRYPVGHNDAGSPFKVGCDGADYRVLGFHVHGGKAVVDNDYGPVQKERPRYGDSLPLAAGKFYSSLPDSRIIALRHGSYFVMNGGGGGDCFDFPSGG